MAVYYGSVYVITSLDEPSRYYIGSTTKMMKMRLQSHMHCPANPKLEAYLRKYKSSIIIRSLEQVTFSELSELRAREDIWIWRLVPPLNADMKILEDVEHYLPQQRKELIESLVSKEEDDEILTHRKHENMYVWKIKKDIDHNELRRTKALQLRELYKQRAHPNEVTTFIDNTLILLNLGSWDMESEVYVKKANICAVNYTLNLDESERKKLMEVSKARIRLHKYKFGTRTSCQMIPIIFERFLGVNVKIQRYLSKTIRGVRIYNIDITFTPIV